MKSETRAATQVLTDNFAYIQIRYFEWLTHKTGIHILYAGNGGKHRLFIGIH